MPSVSNMRVRALLVVAVLVTAAAVWVALDVQSRAIDRTDRQSRAAERMLIGMLDQETGFRGYVLTRDRTFLLPFQHGRRDFLRAARTAAAATRGEADSASRQLHAQTAIADRWRALAERDLADVRRSGAKAITHSDSLRRKAHMDLFRAANTEFRQDIAGWQRSKRREANRIAVAIILALSLVFGAIGYFLVSRSAARDRARREADERYQETQGDFAETMQVARNEREANDLLKRHLERSIDDSSVVVLNRNNSANRLELATGVPDGSPMANALDGAVPQSCLAMRLGRTHDRDVAREPLLDCQVCGKLGATSTCQPLLVSGEVIGSVLVRHAGPLADPEGRRLTESVRQAAPVLANLRNLAIAETRAATDALTGLPNNRAVHDNLKRMVAQAGRTVAPMAAALIDLDHFKQVNDTYGHAKGDEVLTAVGHALANTLRASDFVGRYGGEEFIALMPATGREGAMTACENVRAAIANLRVPGIGEAITASLGVAVLPDDAHDGDTLLRRADRALYAAKARGRNRVEWAGDVLTPADAGQ